MIARPYDLIGDIHGHHEKLVTLLKKLGYSPRDPGGFLGWEHPQGRKVIFLGDYIDRGPASPDVLRTVKGMIDAGDAHAVMGNHEFNAICWHTKGDDGDWLRPHRPGRDAGLEETNNQFAGLEDEWKEWLQWMRGLPLFLELDGLRAVHACWDLKRIKFLEGKTLLDDSFLKASATKGTREYRAVENVLKGPELPLPRGSSYMDKDGIARRAVRSRWWDLPTESAAIGPLVMPEPIDIPDLAVDYELRRVPNYPLDDLPVFFGHYWLPPETPKKPYAPNIACLDYSAATADNPLVAYRWDGEEKLSGEKMVS